MRSITTGQVTSHRAGSPITGRDATTAAKMTAALDDDLDGGPADETARSGIGGTGYAIELSDHTDPRQHRPAVSRRHGKTATPARHITDPNPSPRPVNDAW